MNTGSIGLYIHIPFCLSKCPYCDFYSVKTDGGSIKKYTAAVVNAIKSRPLGGLSVDTVYFGGGTPSVIGAENLAEILQAARDSFLVEQNAEITLEANPGTVDLSFFSELKKAGFNRLSMGLQSANDGQLKLLGRRHNADEAKAAVLSAQKAGFDNISLDIMLGIPQQTEKIVEKSIDFCASLNVSHISAYMLKIEPNTPFYKSNIADICPDEDMQADLYLHAVYCLETRGYKQYEISNFARDGKKSRHNLKYWHCEQYLG
ncbi:MAG TPA: coproporphyrinogen III oxidase, partial [Ruminococcaceae bacterium]|nr:coproporphyrinogen III oxidase [Oscillospiraceae bacterium]